MKARGFTLIELVVVIVILAILAVVALPKFINLSQDAEEAVFAGTYGSFRSAVQQTHLCWRLRAEGADVENLTCGNDAELNSVDYNAQGYPVGTLEGSGTKSIGNQHDCLLVWQGVIDSDVGIWSASETRPPAVPKDQALIESDYIGSQRCRFSLISDSNSAFEYDSVNGTVLRL